MKRALFFLFLSALCFGSWIDLQAQGQALRIRQSSEPDGLNPLTANSSLSSTIQELIFCSLLEYDPESLLLRPYLASSLPKIEEPNSGPYTGGMALHFEIRPEAKWDNGQDVLASDVLFTIKALRNPEVNASSLRPYFEFVDEFVIDKDNPKKFSIYAKEPYFKAEDALGTLNILPEYIYDPGASLQKYSLKELTEAKGEEALSLFAQAFNSETYARTASGIVGCGPYSLRSWEAAKEILLERKKNWWGDKVTSVDYLKAYPPSVQYIQVGDEKDALKMLAEGELDIISGLRSDNFLTLQSDPQYSSLLNFFEPSTLSYSYLAFNLKNPKLQELKTRKAIGHLLNREEMIEILYSGQADKLNAPVSPAKNYYNSQLKGLDYNIEEAKRLLAEAGWKDSNGNGILDKTIDGELLELKLSYKCNTGNYIRREIGFLLQEEAAQVGIEIELIEEDWSDFIEGVKQRDFEIMSLGWVQEPGLDDFKQIWHSSSNSENGSNYVGYENPKVDELIEQIRRNLNPEKRIVLYKELQELIYNDFPYIFLYAPKERLLISKTLDGAKPTSLRPGYKLRFLKRKG